MIKITHYIIFTGRTLYEVNIKKANSDRTSLAVEVSKKSRTGALKLF